MASETTPQFPKIIVFSGLDLNKPGSNGWDSVRAQVMDALLDHGFFEVVFDEAARPLQRDELFGQPMEQLFSLPSETKMKSWNGKSYESYIKGRCGRFEIVIIRNPASFESIEGFTQLMWPQGNPSFSKTVEEISKPLTGLEMMIRKMIFEGFGIDKYYVSHIKSTMQTIRLARFDPPEDQKMMISMKPHADMNILSIVYQHGEEGLEIQTRGGQWLHAQPETFTVLVAETLTALTNGRMKPTIHRVKRTSNHTRYSIGFGSHMLEGF